MDQQQNALAIIEPVESDWPTLWKLADRLQELGFTEENVSRAMGAQDHAVRDWSLWPAHLKRCRALSQSDPMGHLAAFFFIEEALPRPLLQELLGHDVVDLMERLFLTDVNEAGHLYFRFYLYPLLGRLVMTDGHLSNPHLRDQVYPLGGDSHTLARMAPRSQVARSLDLCTGSGVHAVLAGAHSDRSVGVDVNPRALQIARWNARWNRLSGVDFVLSDCYQEVPSLFPECGQELRFDRITANPPFVPTPETIALYRGGGATGEEVTEKIVRGLPQFLAADGIFSMVTNIPHFAHEHFFERCLRWLDQESTWSILVLSNYFWSLPAYIKGHLQGHPGSYLDSFHRWLDSYEAVGLSTITNSQVYVFRSPFPWRIERAFGMPTRDVSSFIEAWIASLRAYGTNPSTVYRLHPGVAEISWLEGRHKAYVEWDADHQWWQPCGLWVESPWTEALARLQANPSGLSAEHFSEAELLGLLGQHFVTLA